MSFQKASDLLRLAEMARVRHDGVSLVEITEGFDIDHRTAQRMTQALETVFPSVETKTDDDRRKYWKLRESVLLRAQGIRDSELVAIESSIRRAEREGASNEVRALRSLRDRLLATMPAPHARRAEADAEAILEAQGYASRPGPQVRVAPVVLETIVEALKGPHCLTITYAGLRDSAARERMIEPYGLLLGVRRYLVARDREGDGRFQHFRLDRIVAARLEPASFRCDPGFDLNRHAARSFGSFHAEGEYGEVVWRFLPHAADVAREFIFHPDQVITEEPDGSLIVRFHAAGWLEMAWHIYQWGDAVEVLAPSELREMVAQYRRDDFPGLP